MHYLLNRRRFLQSTAALGAAATMCRADDQTDQRRVTSEVGPLRKVLVHTPGSESRKTFPMMLGGHSMLTWELLRKEASQQHKAFVKLLEKSGAEVLQFESLLEQAIREARKRETLRGWLRANAPMLIEHEKKITAETLIGRDDELIYNKDDSNNFLPLVSPATSLFFTRDLAVMTPRGVVLCNFNNKVRTFEAKLTQLLFEYAPALQNYPIAFDAQKEDVFVQGGDVMVIDDKTLMIGVGNTTEIETASRLAKQLDMNVLTVELPSLQWASGEWDGLQMIFYHLDCLINFMDRKKVLAVPYLLEKEYLDRNPLLEVLYGFARIDRFKKDEALAMLTEVRNVGWVRRFEAGTGNEDETLGRVKLVDYLKKAGYDIVLVGGKRNAKENSLKHLVERVIRECRFMAPNIVATGPGKVVAYEGNENTLGALGESKVDVQTFPSYELVRANGGPHCLTMPLERG